MNPAWLSYVPYHIARDILLHPDASPVGREQRCDAVALFADVSGFTAISEALGQAGRAGTEELTQILNTYFETMIDLIQSYGGIIGQFGGDALTVLFPYTHRTHQSVTRRAIQCALDMQANMDRYRAIPTHAGTFRLSMKAGLAAGPFLCTTVGGPEIGLKYLIAGHVLDMCADAEHCANQGEVVVHDDLLPFAGQVEIAEPRAGFSHIAHLHRRVLKHPLEDFRHDISETERATLAAYLPPIIAARQTRGQSGFINEHRIVTVLFVHFGGFDFDHDPDVVVKLQTYFSAVMRIIQRYDGYLNKIDMGDKGSKYIVLFGAPMAHEDDEERALRCALELRNLPGVATRIGVNTGFVYCGLVGSAVRQEYTVMGDAVNLAARLMQAAESQQILVSSTTHRHVPTSFAWDRLKPIRVKGKTEPVQAFVAKHIRGHSILQTQELEYALPMVGRETELQQVVEKLGAVLRGRGQIVGITAEAGMGKTRLGAEIIRLATERGLTGYGGECESYGTNTSYLVWHHIWQTFFELDTTWPLEMQRNHLEAKLAAVDPGLVKRLPLLGPALNIPLPDNELTASLDAKLRKASLESLLVTCLRHRARVMPLLLVLEDCHWLDALSYDLLETIARNIVDVPVLIIMLYRPPELAHIKLDRIERFSHFTELALTEFTSQEAEQLIQLKLQQLFGGHGDPSRELVELITEKAQGNPFYIDEMINLLQDQNIDLQDIEILRALELPDSLHSLIISRIDRLLEDEKITLKVASVIGRLFQAGWLWQIYPELGQAERVQNQLADLKRLGFLTPFSTSGPELEYLFKHIVTQEVAYESLAVATRDRLHEQVGEFIESAYTSTLDRYLDLLAYHYGQSQNVGKQCEYFRKAGDAAQKTYANDAAVDYYQRLLPLLPEREHPEVLLKLGKVWELIGKWTEAESTYRRALDLAQMLNDDRAHAQSRNELGRLYLFQGNYEEALAELEGAQTQFEQLDDRQGIAKTLTNMGSVYLSQGDFTRARAHFERGLQIATTIDDRPLASVIVGNLGIIHGMQGNATQSLEYFEQQVQIKTAIGDRLGASIATGNMGVTYEDLGDYSRALDCFKQQLQVCAEIGDQRNVSMAVGNMGTLYSQQGDHARALQCFAQQAQIALELGDRRMISFALSDIADAYKAHYRYEEAERLYAQAITLGRALNILYDLCGYLYCKADLHARQGRYDDAQSLNTEALTLARQVEHKEIEFEAQVLAIRLRVALQQIDTATATSELEALLQTWPEDDQQAALHYELWRQDSPQAHETYRQRAAALYRSLYTETPNIEYKTRYEELTGESLGESPTLPDLPEIVTRQAVDLPALLERASQAIT